MLFILLAIAVNPVQSLAYEKTSTTPMPMSCSVSGTGSTMNSTAYSYKNTLDRASWVWIVNSAVSSDTCTVNITFEYLAGSQANISFKSCDNYVIYLNKLSIASGTVAAVGKPSLENALDSYFGTTGLNISQ